jgi:hypothetical protein
MVMVVNLALGMITPPFGVNLFAACTVAKISLDRIIKRSDPVYLRHLDLSDADQLCTRHLTGFERFGVQQINKWGQININFQSKGLKAKGG